MSKGMIWLWTVFEAHLKRRLLEKFQCLKIKKINSVTCCHFETFGTILYVTNTLFTKTYSYFLPSQQLPFLDPENNESAFYD